MASLEVWPQSRYFHVSEGVNAIFGESTKSHVEIYNQHTYILFMSCTLTNVDITTPKQLKHFMEKIGQQLSKRNYVWAGN